VGGAGAEKWTAARFSDGQRRRPRRLSELRRGGKMLANKRTHELPWELGELTGRLDGGEHGRRAPAACGGGNGGEEHAAVHGGARGGGGGLK
jgi:hypothetical protein